MSPSPRWRDRVDDLSDEFLAIRVGNATPTVAQQRRARADAMRALSPSAHRSRTQVVQIAPPTATRSPAAPAGDNFHDRVLTRLGINVGHRRQIADKLRRGEGVRLADGAEITPTSGGILVRRRPPSGWRTTTAPLPAEGVTGTPTGRLSMASSNPRVERTEEVRHQVGVA